MNKEDPEEGVHVANAEKVIGAVGTVGAGVAVHLTEGEEISHTLVIDGSRGFF